MPDENSQSAPTKKASHRSPNYPAFGLSAALEKVRKVYAEDKRTPTTPAVIAGHLGYKHTDGPGGRALSCLRQYGLLEDSAGMLKVSDMAFNLLHLPNDDAEKAQLMKAAALKPNLYRQLHEEYPAGIPSDGTLTSNLIKRGFNPDSTAGLIADFRDTMAVAKVYDVSDDGAEDESKVQTPTITEQTPTNLGGKPLAPPVDAPTVKSYSYGFEGAGSAVLTITGTYTADDLDDLEASIATSLKTLRRSVKKETVQ
jgi:hypothetical protein